MSYLLFIDTSSPLCSVCISKNDQVLSAVNDFSGNVHGKMLTVFIDQLFRENHLHLQDLSAIVISDGPGSYTGLRIGASVAKGLCFALSVPLITVSTLQAMAWQMQSIALNTSALYIPMIDARRMDAYYAVFDYQLKTKEPVSFLTISAECLLQLSDNEVVYWGGSGAEKIHMINSFHFGTVLENINTKAENLVFLGYKAYCDKQFADVSLYEPNYFKSFGKN